MKIKLYLVIAILLGAVAIFSGCSKKTDEVTMQEASSDKEDKKADDKTKESKELKEPSIGYEEKAKRLTVSDYESYESLVLPEEIKKADILKVKDDRFLISIFLSCVRTDDMNEQEDLPKFIIRTEEAIDYVRDYLAKNAPSVYPAEQAAKQVYITIAKSKTYSFNVDEQKIEINFAGNTNRDFLYILALLKGRSKGWEQLGYAAYLSACVSPYSEFLGYEFLWSGSPYYQDWTDAGLGSVITKPEEMLTAFDLVALTNFRLGLSRWGGAGESVPINEHSLYNRKKDDKANTGDDDLSLFAAASFIGWLDNNYGFANVSEFCYGKKSFEEAFGMTYDEAYGSWKQYILEKYPYHTEEIEGTSEGDSE